MIAIFFQVFSEKCSNSHSSQVCSEKAFKYEMQMRDDKL